MELEPAEELLRLPLMELQADWGEGVRGHERKLWISCRQPGMKSENSHLLRSSDGRLQGEKEGSFEVTQETSLSVTVRHSSANLSTTFLRPRRHHHLHDKQLLCADISSSGELGVCSSEDGKLWVWEADSGETRRNLEGHFGDVYTCRFFPSGVVVLSGGADCRVKIWSAQDGSCPRTFTGHTRGITDTAIVDRGRNFISVSSDGTARLWDCSSGKCLDTVASTGCPINACSLITDSSLSDQRGTARAMAIGECGTEDKLLLLACEDGSLKGYDVRNREPIASYSDSKSPLSACAFLSPTLTVCGADDGVITICDIRNPRSTLNRFQYCESPVRALLPVGGAKCPRRLAVGFRNGNCIVMSSGTTITPTDFELTNLTGPEADPISSVCKSPSDVYTSCRDGSVRAYSIADLS